MIVPSFRRDYTTAVKNAIRRTDTPLSAATRAGQASAPPAVAAAPEHHRLEALGLVSLPGSHEHRQHGAAAVADQVDFRAEAAARAA